MAANDQFRFRVKHPEYGETEVTAADRYGAVVGAAKNWAQRWTTIAKDCEVYKLGKAKGKKRR